MVLPESLHALIVGVVLLGLFVCFVREWVKPDVAAMSAVALLLVLGMLDAKQVLGVFSNSAPITIACLFVISGALSKTGCVDRLGDWLGAMAGHSERRLLLAMLAVGVLVSPFINNTPVVMVMIPAVIAMAGRYGVAPSRLLIPLSYATILGGMITLVGTSTNILVDGVAREMGLAPFSMFEITAPAMLMALVGCGFMAVFAHRLLPVRETLTQQLSGAGDRLFMTELFVPEDSRLAGRTLKEARLTQGDIQVLKLFRGDEAFSAPPAHTRLVVGDRLVVHSRSQDMVTLHSTDLIGLHSRDDDPHDLETLRRRDVVVVETIVGQTSRYVQRPIRDLDLAARYGIHLVAVHRRNASILDIGDDFQLQFGDVLLVEGSPAQIKRFCDNGDLFALTDGKHETPRSTKAPIALATIASVMLLAALNVMPIEALALIGAVVVVITGCIRADEAYKAIEWPILILIFAMLAISIAMRESGLAALMASALVGLGSDIPPWAMLSLVILLTSIATEFLSNNAVAVLFTPVVIGVAQQLGVDPRPFVVGVMFAASCSFATPIGYQTNTLVYTAGNYRFTDFARMGVPMNLITWLTASALIPLFWPL
ncbi:SLC13 family permease [Denitromonas ohlonensis]|uniref:SLC13 family permease n=2 Tax=Denitromonas TaxID=139331 RepID=A0A557RRF1_9RHOO|nr:SLC13 family permease [Denitromonas ohlonensis]TVO67694.1 SLC13 family permease [Denitromonas ohlonensis]TVO76552.1 SLC13 family permease [Denitromonas ohlonensis]